MATAEVVKVEGRYAFKAGMSGARMATLSNLHASTLLVLWERNNQPCELYGKVTHRFFTVPKFSCKGAPRIMEVFSKRTRMIKAENGVFHIVKPLEDGMWYKHVHFAKPLLTRVHGADEIITYKGFPLYLYNEASEYVDGDTGYYLE